LVEAGDADFKKFVQIELVMQKNLTRVRAADFWDFAPRSSHALIKSSQLNSR